VKEKRNIVNTKSDPNDDDEDDFDREYMVDQDMDHLREVMRLRELFKWAKDFKEFTKSRPDADLREELRAFQLHIERLAAAARRQYGMFCEREEAAEVETFDLPWLDPPLTAQPLTDEKEVDGLDVRRKAEEKLAHVIFQLESQTSTMAAVIAKLRDILSAMIRESDREEMAAQGGGW
jgi:hypothetical protein